MIRSIAALVCLALAASPALAAKNAAQTPASQGSSAAESTPTMPDNNQSQQNQGRSLSDRLSQSKGVIHPPAVDPGMQEKPAQTGTMPVIPPPGTPGGNPKVVPK